MAIITGTSGDDTLIVNTDTTSVQADVGTDTAVFSGNYADYTFSQSDSYVPLMTHNTTNQVVSLHSVEQLQFDDYLVSLVTTNSAEFQVNTYTSYGQRHPSATALADGGFVVTWGSDGLTASTLNAMMPVVVQMVLNSKLILILHLINATQTPPHWLMVVLWWLGLHLVKMVIVTASTLNVMMQVVMLWVMSSKLILIPHIINPTQASPH